METVERLGTWSRVMNGHRPEVVSLAERLRTVIVDFDPDVVEVPRAGEGSVAYGLGEKKMSEAYCYLMPQNDRVNLGFYHGVEVDDPDGLLEGTGARLRHVKDRQSASSDRHRSRRTRGGARRLTAVPHPDAIEAFDVRRETAGEACYALPKTGTIAPFITPASLVSRNSATPAISSGVGQLT